MSVASDLQRAFTLIRQLQGTFGASPPPAARVYNSANISITNNTVTALTFDSERWDNGDLHSTSANTSRLTAPITGLYEIGGCVRIAANATGIRSAMIRLNGTTDIASITEPTPSAGAASDFNPSTPYQLAAGDYVELTVYQNSGGALNVTAAGNFSPEFWMVRLPS
jgi:hypothetical protein